MNCNIVVPGQVITAEAGFLRGHGTYIQAGVNGQEPLLIASVSGIVERVNKLISVRPLKSRYYGEVGDLVVGRIVEVGTNRWKVDIGAHKDGILLLSSVNLPGGDLRIRTHEDQLRMRSYFKEGDLISAEIQQVNSEGISSLHTRSLKYGKLENGQLIQVPQILIKKLKQHFIDLPEPINIALILGTNGYIWLTRVVPREWLEDEGAEIETNVLSSKAESMMAIRKLHRETPIGTDVRERISRARNSILALRRNFIVITPDRIVEVYNRSLELGLAPQQMLREEHAKGLVMFGETVG